MNRREVLRLGIAAACALRGKQAWGAASTAAANTANTRSSLARIGPLREPDANGVRLAQRYTSRIVARSGVAPVAGRTFQWHHAPDGGAVFAATGGGWIYVSNSELAYGRGGASALRFSSSGELVDAYPILAGTDINCAGGATPWRTWLSCEETPDGLVWECDPFGRRKARPWPALGAFTHEAVAIDPKRLQLYLTEDLPDGRWYRFTPARVGKQRIPDLSAGKLEAAERATAEGGRVRWHAIADPSGAEQPTRGQAPASSGFDGGEGCWYADGRIYFATKGDGKVWVYDIASEQLSILYDVKAHEAPVLTGVDNVTTTARGDVLVAEDEGDMQIVAITPDRQIIPVLQVVGHGGSEMAGPAFDPSGTRLYFSSQRGAQGTNAGITFEITGPFNG